MGPPVPLRHSKLELSREAIANYQFQVNACHARMSDGTLISIDPGQELDRVDLKEAFAKESVVRVFLAVPKLKLGAANVAPATDPGKPRYVEITQLAPGREPRRQRPGSATSAR